ncbi:hypothetical protein [Salibacterium qingdaonense]|uniref:Uncharacterized protein n=1 Tax=Salibacterium qingdaonense TaxID=266892 RepID=A0A1I4Q4Y6_9BACI|nr:hypothetical protein [Salibacterium qingdaonense]SFM35122.1 hypothetical protein SAMN04488054_1372 [Salibacterium qingdaonense]
MTVESAIHFRGRKLPKVLREKRKAELMELYRENERLLKEMEAESYGTETAGAY